MLSYKLDFSSCGFLGTVFTNPVTYAYVYGFVQHHMIRVIVHLYDFTVIIYLNQAHAGHRPAHVWFLKIDPVRIISMRVHVCVSAPKAIYN